MKELETQLSQLTVEPIEVIFAIEKNEQSLEELMAEGIETVPQKIVAKSGQCGTTCSPCSCQCACGPACLSCTGTCGCTGCSCVS